MRGKDPLDPDVVRAAALKLYHRSEILRAEIAGENLFPLKVSLPRVTAARLLSDFPKLRDWTRKLEESSRERLGHGYSLEYLKVSNRKVGDQNVPRSAIFPTVNDFLQFLERSNEHRKHVELVNKSRALSPALVELISSKPAVLIEHAEIWTKLLRVCEFFMKNHRPNKYVRSLNIDGIDTKFIETNKKVISMLLDRVLPDVAIDREYTPLARNGFEGRYGLVVEPPRVRFRVLCDSVKARMLGLSDFQVLAFELGELNVPCKTVFIVENKITGLEFPEYPGAIVIFGLGKAIDLISRCSWLRDRDIIYFGDIDTHGFHILSCLRAAFPHARSMHMDRETLLGHKQSWGKEKADERYLADLPNLNPSESEVYDGLRNEEWGHSIRLEQENLPSAVLASTLAKLPKA